MIKMVLEYVDHLLNIFKIPWKGNVQQKHWCSYQKICMKKALANEYRRYVSLCLNNIFHGSQPIVISLCEVKSIMNEEE